MLNDTIVVQSALSAFNNAALIAPAFFWHAVLALPLFAIIYWCSDAIANHLKWTRNNILEHASKWTAGLTLAWIVLFSGNYGVLRDSLSVLPLMTAALIFVTTLFVSSHTNTPLRPRRLWHWGTWLVILILIGASDTHTWWGPLLQIGAFITGVILGQYSRGQMRPISGIQLIILMTTTAILMQPEFFRFGQLGNLTLVHLLWIACLGSLCALTIATNNISPCGKIRPGVYAKIKWLMRVICLLCLALFILTEAVPVFIGTLVSIFIYFTISIWHSADDFSKYTPGLFALTLILFGVLISVPAISALGILYWTHTPHQRLWHGIRSLL